MTGIINVISNLQLNKYIPVIAFIQVICILVIYYKVVTRMQSVSTIKKTALPKGVLDSANLPNLYYRGPWLSAPQLPRVMSAREQTDYFILVKKLQDLFSAAGIEYIMCDGTLLGSFMSHGFLPWDDDVDVMVNIKYLDQVKLLFLNESYLHEYGVNVTSYHTRHNEYPTRRNVEKKHSAIIEHGHCNFSRPIAGADHSPNQANQTINPKNCSDARANVVGSSKRLHKLKFYSQSGHVAGGMPWKWPFIDIKYYSDNGTHISNIDFSSEIFHVHNRQFYPLGLRPFGPLWLPAPKDTRAYLRQKYRYFRCHGAAWNHKKEERRKTWMVTCKHLTKYYPFVYRYGYHGRTIERLKIGHTIVHNVAYNERHQRITGPFTL